MLEVDYELNRQEGAGHERVFHVDEGLKTINSNAIYIEAPNAKGKSTFLNILAIALYGDRLDETDSRISQSLRSDIKYMTERENQNYTFKVIIKSKDESIQLISTKANPNSDDIEVKEIINGKERFLPLSTFRDEYFLIYDIPEDPLNRITEILSDVKTQQIRYKKRVAEFKRYLGEVKQEIALSRNESEIKQKKQSISEYKVKSEELSEKIETIQNEIQIIESYLALREIKKYIELSLSYEDTIDRKSKTKVKHQTNVKTFNTRHNNKKNEIDDKMSEIRLVISEVTFKIENLFIDRNDSELKAHIKALKNTDLYADKFKLNPNISGEIKYFKQEISNDLNDKKIKESGKIGSFYQEIISIIEQYKSIEISIPGIEKSMDEFILSLNEEYEKNSKYKLIFDELNDCAKKLNLIIDELNKIPKELGTLKMLYNKREELSSNPIDDGQLSLELDDLTGKLESAIEKVDKYKKTVNKHGISIDENSNPDEIDEMKNRLFKQNKHFIQIFKLDEKSILSEIQAKEAKKDNFDKELEDIQNIIDQYELKLSDLESRELHKYHSYSQKINDLSVTIDNLERNIINYDTIIQKIADGNKLTSVIEIEYNKEISLYFAKKIPEFPYINEFIQPSKIDFLNKVIILDNGRKIDMKDISTGQSMSMYIQAVLNRPQDDKRKMVVIFDEGATMDFNSFKPIKRILEKNIDENKIIFAVFAKAIDGELQVIELI